MAIPVTVGRIIISVEIAFVTVPVEISRITVAVEIADALGIGIRILDVEVFLYLSASVRSHRHLLRELETPRWISPSGCFF